MRTLVYGRINAAGCDTGEARHALIAFHLQQWQRAGSPVPVLEPMCGTGFFLIPFMEAGAEIDTVDASAHMLATCQQTCATKGLSPGLYHQSLEDLALPRQYRFAFIPDRSFALIYHTDSAQACLRQLWEHLQPQGRLMLDVKPSAQPGAFGEPQQTEYELQD